MPALHWPRAWQGEVTVHFSYIVRQCVLSVHGRQNPEEQTMSRNHQSGGSKLGGKHGRERCHRGEKEQGQERHPKQMGFKIISRYYTFFLHSIPQKSVTTPNHSDSIRKKIVYIFIFVV